MRGMGKLGLLMVVLAVTACAPVVYDANHSHSRQRATVKHVAIQSGHTQPTHIYVSPRQKLRPIEITLYAGKSYRGNYFNPVQLVIANNQYVEIPIKDRRGHFTKIYAHYYQGDLHFDTGRNHKRLHGSSIYKHDNSWNDGHKYTHISAGNDYDLSGLNLKIRNISEVKYKANAGKTVKTIKSPAITHNHNDIRQSRQQTVKAVQINRGQKVIVHNSQPAQGHADTHTREEHKGQIKSRVSRPEQAKKVHIDNSVTVKKPTIIKKVERHEESRRVATISEKTKSKNAVVAGGSDQETRGHHEAQKNHNNDNKKKENLSAQKKPVKVSLAGGTLTVDGKKGKFGKKVLTLKNGESRNVTLATKGGLKVNVPVSYHNGTLKVASSSSQYRNDGSWSKGQAFTVNTQGTSHVNNVQVSLVAL